MGIEEDKERKLEREYLDFRFKVVEDKLTQLTVLLEQNIRKQNEEVESLHNRVNAEIDSIYNRLDNHEKMIMELRQKYNSCPINSTRAELKIIKQETAFTRIMMKNISRTFVTIAVIVLLILLSLSALNFEPVIKFLNLIR